MIHNMWISLKFRLLKRQHHCSLLLHRGGCFPPWCCHAWALRRQEAGSDCTGNGCWWGLSSALFTTKHSHHQSLETSFLTKYRNSDIHVDLWDLRARCVWRQVTLAQQEPAVSYKLFSVPLRSLLLGWPDVLPQQAETEPGLVAENGPGHTSSSLQESGSSFGKQHSTNSPSNRP